ncbi:uncharacterized protein A4U43_C08F17960 [Asparagus officinalis]|nr:uncharacterized protein A4U43_C08F17960 [Asparagus officinalis]
MRLVDESSPGRETMTPTVEEDAIGPSSMPESSRHHGKELDAIINEAKATIAVAQARLEVAHHQKEELELDLAELTKKWDSHIVELQAKMERLSVVKSQAVLLNPRILREQA